MNLIFYSFILLYAAYLLYNLYSLILRDKKDPVKPIIPQNNDVIVKFKGGEYNITKFMKKHPGGKKILEDNRGLDIEKLMIQNKHSDSAYELLEKYKIG